MRKALLGSAVVLSVSAAPAMADIVGAGASLTYWNASTSGEAEEDGRLVDFDNDLELDSDSTTSISAYVEHPVPILPNVRVNFTRVKQSGDGDLTTDFGDVPVGEVDSELDMTHTDLTLYYEVLDNWVNLDLGLTARSLDAELTVQHAVGPEVNQVDVSTVLPMGYAAARFDLPFTGASAGAEGNIISFDGDSIYDITAYGQYQMAMLQLRAGYREMSIDYEDGDDHLDVEVSGPFVSAGITF